MGGLLGSLGTGHNDCEISAGGQDIRFTDQYSL